MSEPAVQAAPPRGRTEKELFERALRHQLWCAILAAKCAGHIEIQNRLTSLLLEVKVLTGAADIPA